jgi:hypothetical protein
MKKAQKAVKMVTGLKGTACDVSNWAWNHCKADEKNRTLPWSTSRYRTQRRETEVSFNMASEVGARTRRTAGVIRRTAGVKRRTGVKCVVAQYARTDIRKHSFAIIRAVESWIELSNIIRAESKNLRYLSRG